MQTYAVVSTSLKQSGAIAYQVIAFKSHRDDPII